MKIKTVFKNWPNPLKYVIGLLTVLFFRVVPHPPNVEPVMSSMMPFSKKGGWIAGMIFCLIAIIGYDFLTGTLGVWSLFTAGAYAALGAFAGWFFKNRESKVKNYVLFAIIGTLLYDAVTGIGLGVLVFNQSFMTTLIGQIPFTLYHLMGNIVLSAVLSPLLYDWVVNNPKLDLVKIGFARIVKA